MKIDSFFRKQAGQPDVHGHKGKLDSCCSRKAAESSLPDEMDTRNKSDTDNQILAKGPRNATAVLNSIRDPKAGSAAVNASAPLSEATNKQPTAQPAVAKASEKQAVQAFAINLCDSPSISAAEPAQHGQHAEEVAVDSWAADDHPHQENMNIGAVPSTCAEHAAAGRATSAKVHQHQPAAAGLEPVTPIVDVQTMGDEVPPANAAANASTAKISQDAFLSHDQRKQLLEDCLKELPLLESELDRRPDLTCGGHLVSSGSKKGSQQDLKQQVSVLVEGQSLPLMQLAQHISSLLSSNLGNTAAQTQGVLEGGTSHSQAAAPEDADAAIAAAGSECVSQLVVRNIIQDVASRKSYGIQDGALAPVDAFEDVTAAYHWCWELRSLTGLPKAIKQQADAARRCRKQVLDRLKACSAYIQLAQSFSKSTKTAEAKIAKAAAKLSKLQSLQELQAVASAAAEAAQLVRQQSAAAAKERAAKEEQTAKAAAVCKAEKARQAEADKAAREAERAAKEAEKAAKAAVRAAEAEEKAKLKAEDEKKREQARQSKAAEEARKKEEKAKLKEVKKVAAQAAKQGFHSAQEMQKSQNLFMSFLKKEPCAATPPAGPSTDNSQGASGSQQQQTHQQDTSGAEPVPPAASKKVWAPPCCEPSKPQLALMQHLDDELPGQASTAVQPIPELLAKLMQHWKKLGKQHHGTWGLPPSWAQRPGAAADPEHIAATAAALYGESVELFTLRCWRRKLIKHHDSVRPPYYGSWSRQSRCVCGRKPFSREVELDYEVMSDQDWEEEPEGESLSDDAEDDDDPAGEEGEEDEEGFVVGDGYLSEDEGLRDEDGDAAMTPAGAVSAEEGEKDPIEAAQERAKARGRHVIVVLNDLAPNISWESTTNLDPALLRASLQPTIFTPELAPLQPWEQLAVQVHGRPAAAGPPAAAVAAATPAGTGSADAGANKTTEVAGAVATAAGSAGANGAGRKQSVFPEEMLGALVQHIQANSAQGIDKLTDQFVESLHGACFSGKLTKKSVRDKIRDVTTMKKGRVPCYAVKPEYLAMLGLASGCSPQASPVPTAVWGVRYKEDMAAATPVAGDAAAGSGPAAAEAMQVDDDAAAQQNGAAATAQDLQLVDEQTVSPADAPASGPPAAAAGTSSACVAGVKRPASAEHDVQLSDPGTAGKTIKVLGAPRTSTSQLEQGVQSTQEAAAALPPNKKQKTPGESIARFFLNPKQQQPHQQLDGQQPQNQQAPPVTPQRQQRDAAQVIEATDAAAEAAPVINAAAAAHGNHSGVLPMLTPPSVDAGDRPSLPNSPVPFRMNAAGEMDDVEAGTNGAEQQLQPQRPPINRWHAQADCRGMSLQGGSTSSIPQQLKQQQESSQPFNGVDQQQQHLLGFARASDLAAAGSGSNGVAGQALKPRLQVPQLPEGGRPPDSRFWKQLATWVACVKDPDSSDIDTALSVFSEQHLKQYIQCMPQSVLSAMVKTLGSYSQSLPMRASCARCISNVAQCLAVEQQPLDATSSSPQQAAQASPGGATPAASSSTSLKRKFGASPSPGSSPRSAPVVVSFEELSAEPLLLTNLLLAAADPTNQLKRIQEVVGDGHTGDLQEAFELSRSALRATAALVGVGLPHPLSGNKDYCPAAAAAAGELRLRIASTPQWRGTFNSAVEGKLSSPDKLRSTYALMILHSLLFDPPAASQLVNKPRLARLLVLRVLQRGATAQDWVIKKWSLLVSSLLLSDDMFQSWILPQDGLCQFHKQQKEDEDIVQGLGVLLASCINRPNARLSEAGPDRIILGKCLTLTSLLVSVLGDQLRLPGNNGRLPTSVAELVGGGFAGASHDEGVLVTALKEVAMQDGWQEAAERARQLLDSIQNSMAGEEVEMQEVVSG